MREVVQRGLYYDELETGVVYRHRPGRTLTEADDVVFHAHDEPPGAAPRRRVGRDPAVRAAARQLDDDAVDARRAVRRAGHAGHDRREPRLPRGRVPEAAVPRRHALRRDGGRREAAVRVAAGAGRRDLEHRGLNQDGVLVARAVRTALFWTRAAHEDAARSMPDGSSPDGGGAAVAAAEPGSGRGGEHEPVLEARRRGERVVTDDVGHARAVPPEGGFGLGPRCCSAPATVPTGSPRPPTAPTP